MKQLQRNKKDQKRQKTTQTPKNPKDSVKQFYCLLKGIIFFSFNSEV